jgi:glycerophosphoryl diester phosphodiesterase
MGKVGSAVNGKLVIAHRGVHDGAAENTIRSFANAIDVRADMIEFDVRLTSDGEMVAFHDSHVQGTPVGQLTRARITSATGAEPPLLDEVLGLCAGKIGLDVELKEGGYVDRVTDALRSTVDLGQVVITSFLPAVVAEAKSLLPEVRTGLLVGARNLSPVAAAIQVGADYLAPHVNLARMGAVRRAAQAGLPCLVWTVNSDALIRAFAADPRVAGIITDRAERALQLVAAIQR